MNTTQQWRLWWRTGFFVLFVLAPPLDLFRYDLTQGHFFLLGIPWTLGIGGDTPLPDSINLVLRGFLPVLAIIAIGIAISWRYGRLYCGWLCPHFSVVEIINALMRRATGKPSLWEKAALPEQQSDGVVIHPNRAWWPVTLLAILFFALLWAVTLLTYLLPPAEIWGNLFSGTLTRNQSLFIAVATGLLVIEFSLARHLFCRYGCAVGLFQSLVWMGNKRALTVGFDRQHADLCTSCDRSCEHACPMRLKPRRIKRYMFTCTQCQQCVQACDNVNEGRGILQMVDGDCAIDATGRTTRSQDDGHCFSRHR